MQISVEHLGLPLTGSCAVCMLLSGRSFPSFRDLRFGRSNARQQQTLRILESLTNELVTVLVISGVTMLALKVRVLMHLSTPVFNDSSTVFEPPMPRCNKRPNLHRSVIRMTSTLPIIKQSSQGPNHTLELSQGSERRMSVLIVGARLCGLATAIGLRKVGIQVTVLERSSDLREVCPCPFYPTEQYIVA